MQKASVLLVPIKVGSPLHIFTRGHGWALATLEANVLVLLKWLHFFFFNEVKKRAPLKLRCGRFSPFPFFSQMF